MRLFAKSVIGIVAAAPPHAFPGHHLSLYCMLMV